MRGVLGRELADLDALEEDMLLRQQQLEVMRDVVVIPLSDIAVLDATLAAASQAGVVVGSAVVGDPGVVELEGNRFLAAPYTVKVDGELNDLLDFLALLEAETLETLAVKRVTLSDTGRRAVATIDFAVYSQVQETSPTEGAVASIVEGATQ